jgi:DNA-binding response OmpR family regulator
MQRMAVNHTFLLIGKTAETQWPLILQRALSPLGKLHIVPEEEAVQAVIQGHYDVIIIDAGAVRDTTGLVSRLRAQRSEVCIVVATASPTWQRAREALQAGAADYIRKSLDEKELCSKIQAVLKVPPPPWPSHRRRE